MEKPIVVILVAVAACSAPLPEDGTPPLDVLPPVVLDAAPDLGRVEEPDAALPSVRDAGPVADARPACVGPGCAGDPCKSANGERLCSAQPQGIHPLACYQAVAWDRDDLRCFECGDEGQPCCTHPFRAVDKCADGLRCMGVRGVDPIRVDGTRCEPLPR